MLDQYFDLLGACAQGGAQAFGDAVLLAQLYLMLLIIMLAALIVACCARLLSPSSTEEAEVAMRARLLSPSSTEEAEVAMRARLWERFRVAWAADEAAEAALRLTANGRGENER